MDLKGLEYMVSVAELGSFTRAAEVKRVAQPALSRKISKLESEFGVVLFDRTGHHTQLTEAGKKFYRWACQILSDCDSLERELWQLRNHTEHLLLSCFTEGAVPFVAEAVRSVRERHPEVEVYTQSISSMLPEERTIASAIERLWQKRLNILFEFKPQVCEDHGEWLAHKCIEKGGLCAFVGNDHPLFEKESVTSQQLRDLPLIFPPQRFSPVLTTAMENALHNPTQIKYSSDSTDFRVRVITEGVVGIMPISSRTLQSSFLHCLPISDITEGFDLIVLWNKEDQNPALSKFLSVLS